MTTPARPMRADAARNRAAVLAVAYDVFAAEGLSVPIDEIARRAGVGAGTVYRHFPTKKALIEAVLEHRLQTIVADGHALLGSEGPAEALFAFLRQMARTGSADYGLVDALSGHGIDMESAAPGSEAAFLGVLRDLLSAAQHAGSVRRDVGVPEIKSMLMMCKASQSYGDEVASRIASVIIDGLRVG